MKIGAVIIGLGVIAGDGVCITHDVELTDKKLIKEIQKIVSKNYSMDDLFEKKKKKKL